MQYYSVLFTVYVYINVLCCLFFFFLSAVCVPFNDYPVGVCLTINNKRLSEVFG